MRVQCKKQNKTKSYNKIDNPNKRKEVQVHSCMKQGRIARRCKGKAFPSTTRFSLKQLHRKQSRPVEVFREGACFQSAQHFNTSVYFKINRDLLGESSATH